MADSITVTAPSRLHFGLFGGMNRKGYSYGGVGAMVNEPGIELQISPAPERTYRGSQRSRLKAFADLWFRSTGLPNDCEICIDLVRAPESHIGLGTGTQLGLSVSAALFQYYFDEIPGIERLAACVQRGRRSAVGTYGFMHGGFIVDHGKKEDDSLAEMDLHLPFPQDWCFVLLKTDSGYGLSGRNEESVFDSPWTNAPDRRRELIGLAKEKMVPSLLAEDFETFSETIHEFGASSGAYFTGIQGGPYNGPRITEIIETTLDWNVRGVGQSSWGPTVYMLMESWDAANHLVERLSNCLLPGETVHIAQASEKGATVEVRTEPKPSPQGNR